MPGIYHIRFARIVTGNIIVLHRFHSCHNPTSYNPAEYQKHAAESKEYLSNYVAVAKFALNDTDNYELVGTDAKLSWEIKAKTVDPEPHKHVFVDGVCECGEKDPNYVEPEVGKKDFKRKW